MVLAVAVIGSVLIAIAEPYRPELAGWLRGHPEALRACLDYAGIVLAALLAGPLLGLAVYSWRLGRRVLAAERFPPPGLAVIHDTAVLCGDAARRRGRGLQIFAALLAFLACCIPVLLYRLITLLQGPPA